MDVKELGFTLLHLGINNANETEGKQTAETLCALFGFESRETDAAVFVNEQFEVMKKKGLGELGHVAIGTKDVEKAMEYLMGKGISFDETTIGRNEAGRIRIVYFAQDIAGFRFHLSLIG